MSGFKGKRKGFVEVQDNSKPESKLKPEIAERLTKAGISIQDQNNWFWKRDYDGTELGVDFECVNNVVVMYASDLIASEIARRFWDGLSKAYDRNWKTVGTKGRRAPYDKNRPNSDPLKNPEFGPASGTAALPPRECAEFLYAKIAEQKKFLADNEGKLTNDIAACVLGTLERLAKWKYAQACNCGEAA